MRDASLACPLCDARALAGARCPRCGLVAQPQDEGPDGPPSPWELAWTLARVSPGQRVRDLSRDGAFALRCRASGARVLRGPDASAAGCDVAAALATLDRVDDPVGLARDLAASVEPGGLVLLSLTLATTERASARRTRWGLAQLARLADAASLRWVEHAVEPWWRRLARGAAEPAVALAWRREGEP